MHLRRTEIRRSQERTVTTYSVRCCVAKCRHRRVVDKHPDDYKRPPKCPKCGGKKGWRVEARKYNQRGLCNCNGPDMTKGEHFPHRVTHPYCDHHPLGFYNQARARGVAHEDIPAAYGGGKVDDDPADG
jgi:hypothetical protein